MISRYNKIDPSHHIGKLDPPRKRVRILRTGAPIHQDIVKIINNSFRPPPNVPEVDWEKEFPLDHYDVILPQGIVKLQFI
jgi:hypothetical protein